MEESTPNRSPQRYFKHNKTGRTKKKKKKRKKKRQRSSQNPHNLLYMAGVGGGREATR